MCSERVRRGSQVTQAAVTSWPLTPQIMVTLTFTHLHQVNNRTEILLHIVCRLASACSSAMLESDPCEPRVCQCCQDNNTGGAGCAVQVCTSGPGDIQHLTLTLDVSIKTWQLEHIIVILFKCIT